jgi:glycerol-3-phosphate acyltransferase PlsY
VLVAGAVGYLLGSISPAVCVARVFGVDLYASGSGNPGATNVGRTLGARWGVIVGVIDIAKGFVPAAVFGIYVGEIAGEVAGLAAVLGHITSPFLKGRGGKGVATTLGAILGVQPWLAIPVLITFGIGLAIWHRVGLGAALAAIVLALSGVVGWAAGLLDPSDAVFAVVMAGLVLGRHIGNVRRAALH